jgi:hypothetical protein
VNHQHAEEGLRDGLNKAAKFCGNTTDTISVLYNGFSRNHASLEESSEHGHQPVQHWTRIGEYSPDLGAWRCPGGRMIRSHLGGRAPTCLHPYS